LVDDEMKVLPELKLHEAADMMQVFRKDSPFNLILARELALNVLVAGQWSDTSRWRRTSTCSAVAPQQGAKTPREKSSPNETPKH
jgi:hypothetical protein